MKTLVRWLIRGYQVLISPVLHWAGGPGAGCRFYPTCSEYMLQAVEVHGVIRGIWLGLKRLARCHPWGGEGDDPVPPRASSHCCANHEEQGSSSSPKTQNSSSTPGDEKR